MRHGVHNNYTGEACRPDQSCVRADRVSGRRDNNSEDKRAAYTRNEQG
jgi:hypothetical protein